MAPAASLATRTSSHALERRALSAVAPHLRPGSGGALLKQGLVLNLNAGAVSTVEYQEFLFFAIIGIIGGILGALYVRGVVALNALRRRLFRPAPLGTRWRRLQCGFTPRRGHPLNNAALAEALPLRRTFSEEELEAFAPAELSYDSHVLGADGRYYRPAPRSKARIYEAVGVSLIVFTIFFFFPFFFGCSDACPAASNASGSQPPTGRRLAEGSAGGVDCGGSGSGSGSGGGSGAGRRLEADKWEPPWVQAVRYGRRLAGGGGAPPQLRWNCARGQVNDMASLMHNGQEGIILNMLSRDQAVADVLTWHLLLPFMLMYVLVAICVFGIFVPAGNFIPALTIGAVADTR